MKQRNQFFGTAMIAAACVAGFGCSNQSVACRTTNTEKPWLDTTMSPECWADALVAKLSTVEEKLALSGGLREYGIIPPQGSDGPAGPSQTPGAISLPNGLALAAAFEPELAQAYGEIVGRVPRGRQAGMLGPTVDIARTWRSGRVPEGFGEDPFFWRVSRRPSSRRYRRRALRSRSSISPSMRRNRDAPATCRLASSRRWTTSSRSA
jgi:hypothetical protein